MPGEAQARRHSTALLLSRYRRTGDRTARARVIEDNLPLVRSLASQFSRSGVAYDDLVQVGSIGLIKAVDGYRVERGGDLGAYAVPTIVGELRRHARERRPRLEPGGFEPPSAGAVTGELRDTRSEAELERTEARAVVRSGLRSLTRRERRIVGLRFYRDLSQQRIADEVGLSQVQVSRILADSLVKLRQSVGQE